MQRFRIQRRLHQLVLDALFVALVGHFFVTGSVVPHAVIDFFRDDPQVSVVSEPADVSPIDARPALEDPSDPRPGT